MKRILVVLGLVGSLFVPAICLAQGDTVTGPVHVASYSVSGSIQLASNPYGHPTGSEICKHITVVAATHTGSTQFPGYTSHACAGPKKATGSWMANNRCEYSLSVPNDCLGKELFLGGSYSGSWSESLGGGTVVVDPQEGSAPPTLTVQRPKAVVPLRLRGGKI